MTAFDVAQALRILASRLENTDPTDENKLTALAQDASSLAVDVGELALKAGVIEELGEDEVAHDVSLCADCHDPLKMRDDARRGFPCTAQRKGD